MKVRFVRPNNQHYRSGFIEYIGPEPTGSESLFELARPTTFDVYCKNYALKIDRDVFNEPQGSDKDERLCRSQILCEGQIRVGSRGRPLGLSALGSSSVSDLLRISIGIHPARESASVAVLGQPETWHLRMFLVRAGFDWLVSELEKKNTQIVLRLKTYQLFDFYVQNPEMDNYKVAKALVDIDKVENLEQTTDVFPEASENQEASAQSVPAITISILRDFEEAN